MSSLLNALKGLKRNFSMASASMILVLLTLLVVGAVAIIAMNGQQISKNIVDSISIYAYVEKGATEEEIKAAQQELEKIPEIDGVKFSTADNELKDLSAILGKNGETIIESFSGEDNPLPATFQISISDDVEDLKPVVQKIEEISAIAEVNQVSTKSLENLIRLITGAQIFGAVMSLLLFVISLFIITSTIKIAITARRKEIEIMRLVGATKGYIRRPFLFEGGIIGLVSAICSTILLAIGYNQLYFSNAVISYKSDLISPETITIYLCLLLPIIGILIGVIGSALALRRYLKR